MVHSQAPVSALRRVAVEGASAMVAAVANLVIRAGRWDISLCAVLRMVEVEGAAVEGAAVVAVSPSLLKILIRPWLSELCVCVVCVRVCVGVCVRERGYVCELMGVYGGG